MKRNLVKQSLVCFRRWSRKAYAAFCSVGKCVVIGFLKKGIADVSLKKQPNGSTLLAARRPERVDTREEEAPEKDSPTGGEAWTALDCFVYPQRAAEGAGFLFLDANGDKRAGWVQWSIHPAFCVIGKNLNYVGED